MQGYSVVGGSLTHPFVLPCDLGEEPVQIGMPVEMVTRKIREDNEKKGMIVYGYKFRPVINAQ